MKRWIAAIVTAVGIIGSTPSLGVSQDLQFTGRRSNVKSPNLLNYSANLVLSAPTRSGVTGTETFLTGNAGGGVKWIHLNAEKQNTTEQRRKKYSNSSFLSDLRCSALKPFSVSSVCSASSKE